MPKRSPEKVIVGIVGGSVAQSFFHWGLRALENALKKDERFSQKEFEFVRLAVHGHKQPQQLMMVNYMMASGAEFDMIINIDGFNEIVLPWTENIPRGVLPIYPRDWFERNWILDRKETMRTIGKIAHLRYIQTEISKGYSYSLLRYSVSVTLLSRKLYAVLESEIQRLHLDFENDKLESKLPMLSVFRDVESSEADVYHSLVSLWERCSLLIHYLSEANETKYFHFLQPNQYFSSSGKLMNARQRKIALGGGYKQWAEKGYNYLVSAGSDLVRKGVRFSDLSPVFSGVSEEIYIDDCCHFNERGNEILAKAIADHILMEFGR